jgi:predicted ATPase with chaperone activity
VGDGVPILEVSRLLTSTGVLMNRMPIEPARCETEEIAARRCKYPMDFNEVKGREFAKPVVEVAAAGGHIVPELCLCLMPTFFYYAGWRM